MDRTKLLVAITYALLTVVGFYAASVYLDPDFGWRLQLGRYIALYGIPHTDLYSYTMPSFHLVDHEWLTHVGLSKLYSYAGYSGLAILSVSIFILTVNLICRKFHRKWIFPHMLLVSIVLLHYFGIKPQIISWLFTAILVLMTLDSRWKSRWIYFMPLYFLLWANMHGGFIFGIGILTLKMVSDFYDQRKLDAQSLILYSLSIGVTFINPYGWRLWEELLRTGADTRLRLQIQEWTPQFLYFSLSSFFIVAWYIVIFIRYWKYATTYERLLVIITLMLGFSSSRNFPLWVVASTPVIARLFMFFIKESGKNRITKDRIHKFLIAYSLIIACIAIFETVFLLKEMISYSEINKYPRSAVAYLRSHPDHGNMLSAYEWGGYLIWKYPEKKVFIDGLMPSWRQSVSAHPGESADALGEFTSFLVQKTPMEQTLRKYHITTLLMPSDFLKHSPNPQTNKYIDKFKKALRRNRLKSVYSDQAAVIYR